MTRGSTARMAKKAFLCLNLAMVLLATGVSAVWKNSVGPVQCRNMRNELETCGPLQFCSESSLDKGCRNCSDILQEWCEHDPDNFRQKFPTCGGLCESEPLSLSLSRAMGHNMYQMYIHVMPYRPTTTAVLFLSTKKAKLFTFLCGLTHFNFKWNVYMFVCPKRGNSSKVCTLSCVVWFKRTFVSNLLCLLIFFCHVGSYFCWELVSSSPNMVCPAGKKIIK